jgi:hypothetical protein
MQVVFRGFWRDRRGDLLTPSDILRSNPMPVRTSGKGTGGGGINTGRTDSLAPPPSLIRLLDQLHVTSAFVNPSLLVRPARISRRRSLIVGEEVIGSISKTEVNDDANGIQDEHVKSAFKRFAVGVHTHTPSTSE